MSRPTITVVTPTHPARVQNGMLQRAQQSVWTQTLLPDAHAIAVDNDKAGAAPTRQRALMMAQTDFVAFLDSDDFFFPEHLEALMNHQQETGADFVYSWFKVCQRTAWGDHLIEEDPIFPKTHYTNPFNPDSPIETTITTLVRTELAKEVGFQPLNRGHNINSGEDRYFTLHCLEKGAKISHLVRKTWAWSHHGANTSGLPTKGDAA
jgi:glycosyltransferase involved in cell wall biosynthesis